MSILSNIGDVYKSPENRVAFGDGNLIYFHFIFLQLFCTYLSAEFFPGINSKWIRFTVFPPPSKKNEITGRKTFLGREKKIELKG